MQTESPVVQHPSSKARLATGQEADYGAEKCEAWCREYKSCNLEITAHAEKKRVKKLLNKDQ